MQLYLLNFFSVFALLATAFLFWRKGREEHFEVDQLFDGFILSTVAGLLAARLTYVALHFSSYGWSVAKWLNFFGERGLFLPVGLAVAGFYLFSYAKKRAWDAHGLLDLWLPAVAVGLGILLLGVGLTTLGGVGEGSGATLVFTNWQLPYAFILAGLSFALARYLMWLELRYRSFLWYRSAQNLALSGFVWAFGLLLLAILFLVSSFLFVETGSSLVKWTERFFYFAGIWLGGGILLWRAGKLGPKRKKISPRKV